MRVQDGGHAELAEKVTAVGWGLGLEFRESIHVLRSKNTTLVQAGMAFNVSIGKRGNKYLMIRILNENPAQ